jgi:hypothetical protein
MLGPIKGAYENSTGADKAGAPARQRGKSVREVAVSVSVHNAAIDRLSEMAA